MLAWRLLCCKTAAVQTRKAKLVLCCSTAAALTRKAKLLLCCTWNTAANTAATARRQEGEGVELIPLHSPTFL